MYTHYTHVCHNAHDTVRNSKVFATVNTNRVTRTKISIRGCRMRTTQHTNQSYSNGFLTIIVFAIKQMHESFVRPFNGERLFFITYIVSFSIQQFRPHRDMRSGNLSPIKYYFCISIHRRRFRAETPRRRAERIFTPTT